MELLVVDASVATSWALLRVHIAADGRRMNLNDSWIAATALAQELPVVTQDDDFAAVQRTAGLVVTRV